MTTNANPNIALSITVNQYHPLPLLKGQPDAVLDLTKLSDELIEYFVVSGIEYRIKTRTRTAMKDASDEEKLKYSQALLQDAYDNKFFAERAGTSGASAMHQKARSLLRATLKLALPKPVYKAKLTDPSPKDQLATLDLILNMDVPASNKDKEQFDRWAQEAWDEARAFIERANSLLYLEAENTVDMDF